MKKAHYIINQKIGEFVYLGNDRFESGKKKRRIADFKCHCGQIVTCRMCNVKSGNTKSCGCEKYAIKHGHAKNGVVSLEYQTWEDMRQRCNNPNHESYSVYGGRGIKICPEWDDFSVFLSDMGSRPSKKHTLDKIDNDGNYCKANCRWATQAQQMRNTSRNVWIEHDGKRMVIKDWAIHLDISYKRLIYRIRVLKWPLERAFIKEKVIGNNQYKKYKTS